MARAAGIRLNVAGAELVAKGSANAARMIDDAIAQIMRGPVGAQIEDSIKALTPARTGYTKGRVKRVDKGKGVEIGIPEGDKAKHPHSPRGNARSIGIWLESGTQAHWIPRKIRPGRPMIINGNPVFGQVRHPGTKAVRPVGKTLRAHKEPLERMLIRELDRRVGPHTHAQKAGR